MIRFIRSLISPNRLERFFREHSEQELQTFIDDRTGAGGLVGGEVLIVVEVDG